MFSVASAAFMPYGPFCISIGYIFGIGVGFAVQSLAIFVSSAFIYVIGRLFLRKRVSLSRGASALPGRSMHEQTLAGFMVKGSESMVDLSGFGVHGSGFGEQSLWM